MIKNKSKAILNRSLVLIVGLVLGLLISAQWRTIPLKVVNPAAPLTSLKETRDLLYTEQDQLKVEVKNIEAKNESLQNELKQKTLSQSGLNSLENKKILAGKTALTGPGLEIVLDDSKRNPTTEQSIIHASDIRDIINLLWGSGAEGISINNERVVISSAIDCIINTILVNNSRLSNPFTISVTGNRELMYQNISNPSLLSDLHNRAHDYNLTFNIDKKDSLIIPAYSGDINSMSN